jgi:predicted HD phosphohydrolase
VGAVTEQRAPSAPTDSGTASAGAGAPFASVGSLLTVLRDLEAEVGEFDVIDARAHLLQTAARLAAVAPDDDELVAAGLVHDLATSLQPGCPDHAAAGALLVAPLLGARVGALVAGHAEAKRYLVTTDPEYGGYLSAESTASLARQGGPMTPDEVRAFAAGPEAEALVALRRADDAAKVPGAPVPSVDFFAPLLQAVADRAGPPR